MNTHIKTWLIKELELEDKETPLIEPGRVLQVLRNRYAEIIHLERSVERGTAYSQTSFETWADIKLARNHLTKDLSIILKHAFLSSDFYHSAPFLTFYTVEGFLKHKTANNRVLLKIIKDYL